MAAYEIYVLVEPEDPALEARVQAAVAHALSAADAPEPCALTVNLTTAEAVRDLNREYAGKDETTDVLSFPAEDEPYAVEPGEPPYLGDVIIAVPVAAEQAERLGRTLTAELQTLAIHGTLHLLGYDHGEQAEKAEMERLETEAAAQLAEAEA